MTWDEYRTAVRQAVFPEDEAENLIANHNRWILDSIIDMQRRVPCLQQNNLEKVPQCATYYNCGQSVFAAPVGYIKRLYTTSGSGVSCCQTSYEGISPQSMRDLAGAFASEVDLKHPYGFFFDTNVSMYVPNPDLTVPGFEFPDSTMDKPCRASKGYFTLERRNIYLLPYMQWDEIAWVEYDGVKLSYNDDDVVTFDRTVTEASEDYLRYKVADIEDCDPVKASIYLNGPPGTLGQGYNGKVATLTWDCERQQKLPPPTGGFDNCC